MLPHERKLLTDRQLREASPDQIEDLVQRLNLIFRERGEPAQLVWKLAPSASSKEPVGTGEEEKDRTPSDPLDPPIA